jgi:hypothetical protein
MSFWTGLEAFTGHRPGAFTGMTMKDLFDKDMWDRLPRTWSGQKTPTGPNDIRMGRGGEPMMTNWYNRNAGVAPVPTNVSEWVNPNTQASPVQMNQLGTAQAQMFPYKRQDVKAVPVPGWTAPRNPAEVIQETGPYWGMGDPYSGWGGYLGSAKKAHMGMGASGYQVPPTPQFDSTMADMTTVKKITDDASPNTITQTVKQKVPANPTNTLMNMKSPTDSYTGWGDLWRKTILNPAHAPSFVRNLGGMFNRGIDSLGVLARKRHEEEMLRRQRGY